MTKKMVFSATIRGAIIVIWAIILAEGIRMITFQPAEPPPNRSVEHFFPQAIKTINRAVTDSIAFSSFHFPDTARSPFRHYHRKKKTQPAKPRYHREPLQLKGVLLDNNVPMVILEDERGRTFICEQGDTVYKQSIVAIHREHVTLRDVQGTFVLKR